MGYDIFLQQLERLIVTNSKIPYHILYDIVESDDLFNIALRMDIPQEPLSIHVARSGKVDMMKALHNLHPKVASNATGLDMILYLDQLGYNFKSSTTIRNVNHLDALKWLNYNNVEIHPELKYEAICANQYDVLEWLMDNNLNQFGTNDYITSLDYDDYNMVLWYYKHGLELTDVVINYIIITDNIKLLYLLKDLGCQMTIDLSYIAICNDNVELAKFCLNECGIPIDYDNALNHKAFRVIRWLEE